MVFIISGTNFVFSLVLRTTTTTSTYFKMLTMTTTTVGIFMYKCGLCPAFIGKRLIIWRQQAATRLAHTKKSHIAIFFVIVLLCSVYVWTMYPQMFYFIRYHSWRTSHRTVSKHFPKLGRNLTFPDVCSQACVPEVDVMRASGYDVPYAKIAGESLTLMTTDRYSEDILEEFLKHYSKMRRVHRIILHWTKTKPDPPDYEKELDLSVPLIVVRENSTSLLSRFRSMGLVKTDGVMIIDDDVILSRDEVYHAFSLWQSHPWGIVGFYGGAHTAHGNYGYKHSMVPFNFYSMVQRGAVIVHKQYMKMYLDKFSKGVAKVDCDDMALNYMISAHCKCAAAYYVIPKSLYIRVTDKFEYLSSKWQYKSDNNECLNYYSAFFRGMPLKTKTCFW